MSVVVNRVNPYAGVRQAPIATGAIPAFNPAQQQFRVTKKLPASRNAFMKVWR